MNNMNNIANLPNCINIEVTVHNGISFTFAAKDHRHARRYLSNHGYTVVSRTSRRYIVIANY